MYLLRPRTRRGFERSPYNFIMYEILLPWVRRKSKKRFRDNRTRVYLAGSLDVLEIRIHRTTRPSVLVLLLDTRLVKKTRRVVARFIITAI